MQEHRGLAVGIAAQLPIDAVPVADIEHAVIVGFDLAGRRLRMGSSAPEGRSLSITGREAPVSR